MHNFHAYNDEKWVIFNGDVARENFTDTCIQTRDLPVHTFFIAAVPSLQVIGLLLVTQHGRPLLVASTLGDLVASAKAIILIASNQT